MHTNVPAVTPAMEQVTALETFRAIAEARRILNAAYGTAARLARAEGHTFQAIADVGDITRPTAFKLVNADVA